MPVGPWENFDRDGAAGLLLIFEEERIRRNIHAGVVDEAGASSPVHGGQSHPLGGHHRPRPHRHDDGICLNDTAIDLNTPHGRSIRSPDDAGDPTVAQFGTLFQGGAHHGGGEGARVNDRGRLRRAEPRLDDHAVGEPIELGRLVATGVALGNDETAIGSHAAIAPIARNLVGQGGVKREAPPRQCIKRGARAPVEGQEAARLA